MMHMRQKIREQIVSLLKKENLEKVDQKVFPNRAIPIQSDNLPCICVFVNNEAIEYLSTFSEKNGYTVEIANAVTIDIYTAGESYEIDMDNLSLGVENVLSRDETLNNLVETTRLVSVDISHSGSGEQYTGLATYSYEIRYITHLGGKNG